MDAVDKHILSCHVTGCDYAIFVVHYYKYN